MTIETITKGSSPGTSPSVFLAIDLGTTTLAGQLVDNQGELLAETTVLNPQQELGADILSRLQAAHHGQAERLYVLLIDGLKSMLAELCRQSGVKPDGIAAVAAAGNPGVSCLLRKLPVKRLLFPPHKAPYKELCEIKLQPDNLGLMVPLQLFPLASGFVGGDLIAVLFGLSLGPYSSESPVVVIDIGTNGELALFDGQRWWVSSAAAGPAFEGGDIETGMVMVRGAVSNVSLDGDRLQLTVADGGLPRGLCGSGLAALIAAAVEAGAIDSTGRIVSPNEVHSNLAHSLVKRQDGWALRFYRDALHDLLLTQTDVRNFQLAKGALRGGVEVLLDRAGVAPGRVSLVVVTGSLGTALPVEVLKRVALLPEPMLDKTLFMANAVLAGLRSYLVCTEGQHRLQELLQAIRPFPLSGTPAFEKRYLSSLDFIKR